MYKLEIKFRYHKADPTLQFCTQTEAIHLIGIYQTLEESVKAGNELLDTITKYGKVNINETERFSMKGHFNIPNRSVSNFFVVGNSNILFFANIHKHDTRNITDILDDAFVGIEYAQQYHEKEVDDE